VQAARPLFAIANQKSKIENAVVHVVQGIERRFPKGKTAFLLHSADAVYDAQIAAF